MHCHHYYIFSTIDFSTRMAAVTRMRYYAKILANDNCKVYLVTSGSNDLSDENFQEIEPNVFCLKNAKPAVGFSSALRFVKRLSTFAESKKGGKTFILYPTPMLFLEFLSIIYLKKRKGYALFYELNEVRKHVARYHDPISLKRILYSIKKIIFKTTFTLTQPLLGFYDGLICISTNIEKFGKRYNENTFRIPILTDPDKILKKSTEVYKVNGVFNIGFSGSISPTKENLDSFIRVVARLKNHGLSVSLNLCGLITNEYFNHLFNSKDTLKEVKYYGNLDEVELSTFLSQQDLLVIPRGYTLQNHHGFSTKLSDYLNHQKMVLVTDVSDNKLFIKDGVNGFIVPPDDEESMFEKLVHILENQEQLKKTIVPNALKTSKEEFAYYNFKSSLSSFLTENTTSSMSEEQRYAYTKDVR